MISKNSKKAESTDERKDVFGNSQDMVEFYKYAYAKSIRRNVNDSCERAIESGEALQKNLEAVLKDLQELIYNSTSAERRSILDSLGCQADSFDELRRYASIVAVLVKTLRCYKIDLSPSNIL